jgi:hypothetical protein
MPEDGWFGQGKGQGLDVRGIGGRLPFKPLFLLFCNLPEPSDASLRALMLLSGTIN